MKQPQCPYCYEGVIVYLKLHDIYICPVCKREVEIKQVDNLGQVVFSEGKVL